MSAYRCLWYLFALCAKVCIDALLSHANHTFTHDISWLIYLYVSHSIHSPQLCTSAFLRFPTVHEEARGHSDWKHIDERYLEGRRRHVLEDLLGFERHFPEYVHAFSRFHLKALHPFLATTATRFTCSHHGLPAPLHFKYRTIPYSFCQTPWRRLKDIPNMEGPWHRERSSLNCWQPIDHIDPVTSRSTRSSVTWIRSSPLCWWSVQASSAWSGQLGRGKPWKGCFSVRSRSWEYHIFVGYRIRF